MSQQALDLRRSAQIVRRHKVLMSVMVAAGALLGAAYVTAEPPLLTATALVVIPQIQSSASASSSNANSGLATATENTATEVVIANSTPVLLNALPNVKPAMSFTKLRGVVQVSSPSAYIISVSARGKNAADAETTANAVARSYVSYVNAPSSPVGVVSAKLLGPATNATGIGPVLALIIAGLAGGLAGGLLGVIVSLAISRGDKRLRERDEIANSISVPVLASLPVSHPSNAEAWTRLLQEYSPAYVYAWQLRKTLQQLGLLGGGLGSGDRSVTVLSLSSDLGALALGPQLAAFAASVGISTALLASPQQDVNIASALQVACAAPLPASLGRPGKLSAGVYDGSAALGRPDARLTIVVATIDDRGRGMPETMRTTATVIGVSAGVATAEQLAQVAAIAAADGREISGILVADPDPADHTTGHMPYLARHSGRRKPRRLAGVTTEIRR